MWRKLWWKKKLKLLLPALTTFIRRKSSLVMPVIMTRRNSICFIWKTESWRGGGVQHMPWVEGGLPWRRDRSKDTAALALGNDLHTLLGGTPCGQHIGWGREHHIPSTPQDSTFTAERKSWEESNIFQLEPPHCKLTHFSWQCCTMTWPLEVHSLSCVLGVLSAVFI